MNEEEYIQGDEIDAYLRNELHGEALIQFNKKLEKDEEFKQAFLHRKLIIDSIKDRGAEELKLYIKREIEQSKKGFFYWKNTKSLWWSAAAVLLASIAIYAMLTKNNPIKKRVGEVISLVSPQNETTIDTTVLEEPFEYAYQSKSETLLKSTSEDSIAIPENIQVVAMGVKIAAINKEVDESNYYRPEAAEESTGYFLEDANLRHEEKKKTLNNHIDTLSKSNDLVSSGTGATDTSYTLQIATNSSESKISWKSKKASVASSDLESRTNTSYIESNFLINFGITSDGKATYEVTDITKKIIWFYNIPSNNPLIYKLNKQYYLKIEDVYYEFDIKNTHKRELKKVTSKKILSKLNEE